MLRHAITGDQLKSDENRILTQLPDWPEELSDLKSFTANMDDYLNDQLGYRDALISGANKFKHSVFNEVLSNQITVGEDGYLFFNSHSSKIPRIMTQSVCGVSFVSKKFQIRSMELIQDYLKHFNASGIITSIAIIPTKAKIYPEKLPKLERSWCEHNSESWIEKVIKGVDSPNLYYPLKLMLKLKHEIPVYFPSFFHWDGELPHRIAMELMSFHWKLELQDKVEPVSYRVKSDLRLQLKGIHIYEDSIKYDYSKVGVTECKGIDCVKGLKQLSEKLLVHTYSKSKPGPTLLLLTDSFGKYIAPNFSLGFSNVIHIDTNNLKQEEVTQVYDFLIKSVEPSHMLLLFHDGGLFGQTQRLEALSSRFRETF